MNNTQSPRLQPALEFFNSNRNIAPSDNTGYQMLNGPMRKCVVVIGRKKFVNLDAWESFIREGGQAFDGGWRKEAA